MRYTAPAFFIYPGEVQIFDLIVIGGGINGAGLARDAAGRGLKVALFEQDDFAEHTSSASTKLIHGGLRYLEHYKFRLVREALRERERLLAMAPHIIWPLEFVLPHARHLRPAWLIRAGLFFYDHLAKRKTLPKSRRVDLRRHQAGGALKPIFRKGFTYADCWVEDSRLVILNVMDAAARGARIFPRTKFISARPQNGIWQAETDAGFFSARAIVNAAGPWVGEVLANRLGRNDAAPPRLVKGSHIITKKLYPGKHAFILQNPDQRIVFVIPYENDFSLIGTTDIPYSDDPARITISDDEIKYLCASVNHYFNAEITPDHAIWTYSGVRPLFDDHADAAAAVTRDYRLDLTHDAATPPLLSIFGGKITTYRRLAEHALEKLLPVLGRSPGKSWTAGAPLPGGDIEDFALFERIFKARHAHLDNATCHRLAYSYGTRAERFVEQDMGLDFGAGLSQAEVEYLIRYEYARTPEDILWRRTKLGLHAPADTGDRLQAYIEQRRR